MYGSWDASTKNWCLAGTKLERGPVSKQWNPASTDPLDVQQLRPKRPWKGWKWLSPTFYFLHMLYKHTIPHALNYTIGCQWSSFVFVNWSVFVIKT